MTSGHRWSAQLKLSSWKRANMHVIHKIGGILYKRLQLQVFYQSEIPHLHLKDVILDSLSTWYQNNLKWHTRRFKDLYKTQVDFHHAGILLQRDFNTTYLVVLYPIARSVFKI